MFLFVKGNCSASCFPCFLGQAIHNLLHHFPVMHKTVLNSSFSQTEILLGLEHVSLISMLPLCLIVLFRGCTLKMPLIWMQVCLGEKGLCDVTSLASHRAIIEGHFYFSEMNALALQKALILRDFE